VRPKKFANGEFVPRGESLAVPQGRHPASV
jgi:hypothetical protein